MTSINGFLPGQMLASIRFVQGYRYLDRCGETLIRLENNLGEGWLTAEPTPQSGALRHASLKMEVNFNSDAVSVTQRESVNIQEFSRVASIAYETICGVIEVERVIGPAVRIIYHRQAANLDDADAFLLRLGHVTARQNLINALCGTPSVIHFTTTREWEAMWGDELANHRLRVQCEASGSIPKPSYDARMSRRTRTLPIGQQKAILELAKKRSETVLADVFSTTLDVEFTLENEFSYRSFSYTDFLSNGASIVESAAFHLARSNHDQ